MKICICFFFSWNMVLHINDLVLLYRYSPKESSLKNSSSGSYCFWRDFTCFIVWKFLDPYDLYLYCGGWVVVVVVGRNLAYVASELRLLPSFLWVLKTTKFLILHIRGSRCLKSTLRGQILTPRLPSWTPRHMKSISRGLKSTTRA